MAVQHRDGLVGFYQTKAPFGSAISLLLYGVNFGLLKKFGGNGSTLRIGVDQVFNSFRFRSKDNLPEHKLVSQFEVDFS